MLNASFSQIYSGIGSILCFHRVVSQDQLSQIGANRALEVTAEFLEAVLRSVKAEGYEVVSLNGIVERLRERRKGEKFIAFTFDDGYRDTFDVVYPMFKQQGAPFAVYVTTSYVDRRATPWWYLLEQALQRVESVRFSWNGSEHCFETANRRQRETAFDSIASIIRNMDQSVVQDFMSLVMESAGIDEVKPETAPIMTWEQIRELSRDGNVTIGAHTVSHYTLGRLSPEQAKKEILESKREIEREIGKSVEHFSYPFGGRNAVGRREFEIANGCGFKTMATTRLGNVFPGHHLHLNCLPRLTVSGNYSTLDHVKRLLSGLESARRRPFERMVTD